MSSCCSSRRMRCREGGTRTRYWHSASRVGWAWMRFPRSMEIPECSQPRSPRAKDTRTPGYAAYGALEFMPVTGTAGDS
jgi:hypothetical protein